MRRLAALLLLPCALLTVGATDADERWDGRPQERDAAQFQAVMLTGHNLARAGVGAAPLVWDDALARDAAAYARELAATDSFEHAEQDSAGENLWMGTRGAFAYHRMVGDWVDERKLFVNRAIPDVSASGEFEDVGHYTQIIWHTTDRVGCALASNAEDDFVVCRYRNPGNVDGERAI